MVGKGFEWFSARKGLVLPWFCSPAKMILADSFRHGCKSCSYSCCSIAEQQFGPKLMSFLDSLHS